MKKFRVCVSFPVYFQVEAEDAKEAHLKAISAADNYLMSSSVNPVLEFVEEIELDERHPLTDEEIKEYPFKVGVRDQKGAKNLR